MRQRRHHTLPSLRHAATAGACGGQPCLSHAVPSTPLQGQDMTLGHAQGTVPSSGAQTLPDRTSRPFCLQREYEDCICFEKPEGEFSVALRATLPRHALLCPDTLQLPTCAAYHFSEATFPLRNVG